MFTPAMTASSVSPPFLITSKAFAQAAWPLALEITTGRLAVAAALAAAALPASAAAVVEAIHFLRLSIPAFYRLARTPGADDGLRGKSGFHTDGLTVILMIGSKPPAPGKFSCGQ